MAGSVKNYRRFYAAFKKVPHYGDEEEQKESLVSTYTKGRTSHLREMTTREYTDMCKALENMCGYGDQRKRHRSICLHLMQELGVNTGDWQASTTSALIREYAARCLPSWISPTSKLSSAN